MKLMQWCLVLIVLSGLWSCSNDDEPNPPQLLKQISYDGGKKSYKFYYDGNRLIRRTYSDPVGSLEVGNVEYIYNQYNQLSQVRSRYGYWGKYQETLDLKYNENGQLIEVEKFYSSPKKSITYTFEHLPNGTVKQMARGHVLYHNFDTNGTVKGVGGKLAYYDFTYGYRYKNYNETYEYDTNKTGFANVDAANELYLVSALIPWNRKVIPFVMLPRHNVIKAKKNYYYGKTSTLEYTYDAEGFPVKAKTENVSMYYKEDGIVFKY